MSNIPYDLHRFNRLMEESDDFLKNGVFDRAVMCLKQALAMKPDVFKLGIRGLKQAFEKKLRALSTLAKIVNDTKQSEYQIDFACEVTQFYLEKWDENCEKALLLCLQNTMINPQNLAVPGIRLLNLKGFSINDPLLLSLMENALLPDVHLEKILTEKRKELLFLAQEDGLLESHKPFIYALSIQCGINEYVYNVSEIENALVDNLLEGIHSASPEFDQKTNLLVALLSCYRPLHDTHLSQSLSHSSFLGEDGAFLRIIKKHLLDPERENQLASSIPLLNSFKDDISLKVRQQYEEHPYPHWTRLELMEPVDFHEHMDELFPNVKASKKIERATPPRILVAGCGTGYQAIHCALHYRNSQVTGVDLSLSSLAYGKRMAEEMRVANVAFIQGDLLDLEKVPELFDLIECTGVLHHMSDPLAGWSILANKLADDGWMHIGLYSEIARKKIAQARQYVNQKGYKGTQEEIRLCRQEIINSQDCEPVRTVVLWEDFYSMSTCRDLLFHIHEVHFTLLQIAEILEKLNLQFVGFDASSSIQSRFKKMFPEDPFMASLENWHTLEQTFPDTFATMYSFWVKRSNTLSQP